MGVLMKWILFTVFIFGAFASDEKSRMDWFDDLDQRDKDNAVTLLTQGVQHYNGLNQDVLNDMETKFRINPAQTQQLYEFLYSKEKKIDEDTIPNLVAKTLINIYDKAKENLKHFEPGTKIILFGLKTQQFNGKCGIVMSGPVAGRYGVQIEDRGGKPISIKLENMKTLNSEEVLDECMVCYEQFPVSFQFSCGHEVCALCAEFIMYKGVNENCPKCRKPFPQRMLTEWLPLIKIYPIGLTPDISVGKLQHAFPLICCVANLTTVAKCVKMGVNVNTEGFSEFFPLHLVMKYLLYTQVDGAGWTTSFIFGTTLCMNSQNANLPVVEYLINNGANVNQADDSGWTPLFMSSASGHLPVVECLINNKANVNHTTNDGVTPLIIAIGAHHTEIAKLLLRKNANIETTILFLMENERFDLIEILNKLYKEI